MKSVMELHDCISKELFHKKAISAFIWLLSHGRELECKYKDITVFITPHNNAQNVFSLWIGNEVQSFSCIEELIDKAIIDEKSFYEIWNDLELKTLY